MALNQADLAALLRLGARGCHPEEAATNLLIEHGTWLRRQDFTKTCVLFDDAWSVAFIDWRLAIEALDAGDLPSSASEANILRLAAALNNGPRVSLRDTLLGLDAENIRLVAQAVLLANGTTNGTVTVPEPSPFPPGVRVVDSAGNVLQDGPTGQEP